VFHISSILYCIFILCIIVTNLALWLQDLNELTCLLTVSLCVLTRVASKRCCHQANGNKLIAVLPAELHNPWPRAACNRLMLLSQSNTKSNLTLHGICDIVLCSQISSIVDCLMSWTEPSNGVDTTGLIIMSGTCCGQEAQSVNDTSTGRSGTRSCWWVVDQTCADPV